MVGAENIELNNLFAIGRLYEFSSNKRFHLINNNFLNDEIGKKALEINQQIKETQGIDLFQATEETDLINYEKALDRFTTSQSNILVNRYEIGDEVKLLEFQDDFSIENLNSYKVSVNSTLKPVLKKHGLIIPDVINLLKSADSVSFVKECASLFMTKKRKDKIILFHAIFDNPEESYEDPGHIHSTINPRDMLNSRGLRVLAIFFFAADKYQNLLNMPIRLFIKGLDLFALAIRIENRVQKFYYDFLIPAYIRSKDLSSYIHELDIPFGLKKDIKIISVTNRSRIQLRMIFMYAIDDSKLLKS